MQYHLGRFGETRASTKTISTSTPLAFIFILDMILRLSRWNQSLTTTTTTADTDRNGGGIPKAEAEAEADISRVKFSYCKFHLLPLPCNPRTINSTTSPFLLLNSQFKAVRNHQQRWRLTSAISAYKPAIVIVSISVITLLCHLHTIERRFTSKHLPDKIFWKGLVFPSHAKIQKKKKTQTWVRRSGSWAKEQQSNNRGVAKRAAVPRNSICARLPARSPNHTVPPGICLHPSMVGPTENYSGRWNNNSEKKK
ncbi:hypothetical protein SCA6_007381 [Theobroma cacao]